MKKVTVVVFGADREKLEHVWLFGSEEELNQYEIIFERLNIEVLYGSKDIMRHLNEKGYQYHWVVLSYPEVAYRYLSGQFGPMPSTPKLFMTL